MQRLSHLYQTINQHKEEMIAEQETAKIVFNRLIEMGSLTQHDNFKYVNSSMSLFNGDLLIASDLPDGSTCVLLGDATGHGLPAALGTMPVFDTFYSMCSKGIEPEKIISTLNDKLKARLPVQYFICAALIHISATKERVDIWNCGLPEVIVYSPSNSSITTKVTATGLPLGIRAGVELKSISIRVETGDRLYAYSDGITEARSPAGEMFGKQRLEACFLQNSAPERLFEEILATIERFTAGLSQGDDLTIIEISL
ncbi:serine/threonine-protein phosphatase [Ectothiorhodospiraceae bacterium BW-2]|nr:serine/threonine-protein phosphatase [Ectothiorhodospiraceae bacterium BW-2]